MAKKKKTNPNQMVRKMPVNSSWFNNVAKSMGFAAGDLVKELLPNTSDFLEFNNISETMNMVQDMRRNNGVRNTLSKQIENIPQINIAKEGLRNALEDIKSGKIYNNERGEGSDEFGFDDMDFGFGDMFDDEDGISFSDNDEGGTDVTVNRNTVNNLVNTLPLAKTMAATTEATINAMGSIAEQQAAMETEKMMMSNKANANILGGLSAINDNLTALVKFQSDATSKFYAASIKYYEESVELIKKVNAPKEDEFKTDVRDDLYTYTGGVKINNYLQVIKKNLEDMKDELVMLTSAYDAMTNIGDLKQLAKNPLGFLAKMSMNAAIPIVAKTTAQAIDASISNIMPALLLKINTLEDSANPMYQYLYKIFNTKNKLSYNVDLGSYEKGAISWDGESKKALVEVIPTHLRRIEAALTGQEERIYNYNNGKFENIRNVRDSYDALVQEKESSGYNDAKLKMKNIARGMTNDPKVLKQFEKDMQEYFSALTKKGSLINPFIEEKDGVATDAMAELGLFDGDTKRLELMRRVFKGLSNSDLIKMQTVGVIDSRKATNAFMDEVRKNPNISGYNNLYNNSLYDKNGKLTYDATKKFGAVDKFGFSSLDYLRDVRTMLAKGIKVFVDKSKRSSYNPNADMTQKILNEEDKFRLSSTSQTEEERWDSDAAYDKVLGMSKEDISKVYADANASDITGRDGKIASKIVNIPGFSKINEILLQTTDVINDATYKMVFGEEVEGSSKTSKSIDALKEKLGVDKDGSVLKGIMGSLSDVFKGVRAYFTGQEYTTHDGRYVPANDEGLLKRMTGFFRGSIDKLFGAKDDEDDTGVLGRFTENFMMGFKEFKATLFGESKLTDKDRSETLSQLTDKLKARLPKAIGAGLVSGAAKTLLASKLGLLGSVILPGGPIGAAITGMGVSFLSQSETFKNWLFGTKDVNGERMGGFVPKSLTDMITKNGGEFKKNMAVGAGAGVLASFFLPGGPITGAILGMGTSLLAKNQAFQEVIYGKDFDPDNKSLMNGAFGKVYKSTIGKINSDNPRLAAFLGTGGLVAGLAQGVGLLPSFLLPGGPITGALLGAATGIMASSDKFQHFLFGEKDIDGKRYGGLFTKFSNWFDTTVISPFKIKMTEINDNIYGFVKGKIINPMIDAFAPLTQAFKFVVDDTKEAMKETWHKLTDGIIGTFNENVIKPFGESLEKFVVDPMKKLFNSAIRTLGKILGTIVASPFKLISGLGNLANWGNERRVMKEERRGRRQELRDSIFGDDASIGGFFKAARRQFIGRDEKNKILNKNLPYRETREQDRINREQELQREMEERQAKREEMTRQYEEDRKFGKSNNWKWASQKQKARREEELKQKEAWFQEQIAIKEAEAVEKLTKVESELEKIPTEQTKQREVLEGMANSLRNIVDKLSDDDMWHKVFWGKSKLGTEDGLGDHTVYGQANDGSDIFHKVFWGKPKLGTDDGLGEHTVYNKNKLTEDLRDKGQSHAEGLDEVPSDGYIAELHEGEMVVPKKGAGFLKKFFGKDEEGNSFVDKISERIMGTEEKPSIFGKMFSGLMKEQADREFNPLNMTRDELETMNEWQDRQRYAQASRKNVDFVQQRMAEEKKEKEERIFRDELLAAIRAGFATGKAATEVGNNLLSSLFEGAKSLLSKLGGASGLLSLLGGAATISWFQNKMDVAEENGISLASALTGEGDEGQKDADGFYYRDNTIDSITKHGVRHTLPKTAKTVKNAYTTVKDTITNAKDQYTKIKSALTGGAGATTDDVIKAAGNADVNFNTYEFADDATRALAGNTDDAFKAATSSKSSGLIQTLVETGKKAVSAVIDAVSKKFPKVGKSISMVDDIFKKLISNADNVYRKFSGKIALYVADGAADFIPVAGQVLEVGMTVWDVATGLTAGNTANLFQVSQEDVDNEMRVICSVLQGLCKFSWFSIIWLLNEISSSMFDVSFLTSLARGIYTSVGNLGGRQIDFSNDLSGTDTSGMTLEQVIQAAGGDISQFKNEDGTFKDISEMNTDELTGISAVERQELARIQYNQENGTNMDKQGYNDMVNQTVGQKIGNAAKKGWNAVKKGTGWLYGKYQEARDWKINKIKQGAGWVADKAVDGYNYVKDGVVNAYNYAKEIPGKVVDKYNQAKDWVGEKVDNVKGKIQDGIAWAYEGTEGNSAQRTAQAVKKAYNFAQETLEAKLEEIGKWFTDKVTEIKDKITDTITDAGKWISKKFTEAKDALIEGITNVGDWFVEKFTKAKEGLEKAVKKVIDWFPKSVDEAKDMVVTGVTNVGDWFVDKFTAAKEGLEKGVKKVIDWFGEKFNTAKEAITEGIETVGGWISDIGDGIKKAFTSFSKTVEDIVGKVKNAFTWVNDFLNELFGFTDNTDSDTSNDSGNVFTNFYNWAKNKVTGNAGTAGISSGQSSSNLSVNSNKDSGVISAPNSTNDNFVFYSQNDRNWSSKTIGDKTMADAGCGPTSIAMAVSQTTGQRITPDVIANMGKNELPGYSTYNLFPQIAKKFSMNYEDTENQNDIINYIKQGTPVILSGRSFDGVGPFTKDGHIVVANKVDGDKVFISDPRGKAYSKYYTMTDVFKNLNKGFIMTPTNMTRNKLSSSKGSIDGINGQFVGGLNAELGSGNFSLSDLNANMGGDGNIKLYEKVLGYAKAFEGKLKYIYGSKAIDKNQMSSDCSGFTHHVFERAAGIDIGAGSSAQHNAGTGVNYNDAQPADLIVFDGHAGIVWDSNKNMIDIGSGMGPKIRTYESSYWKGRNPVIRRVLSNPNEMVSSTISNPNTALGITSVNGMNGGDLSGTTGGTDSSTSSGASTAVEQMGVFASLGNIANNMVASIFNGKAVDLYAAATSSGSSSSSNSGTVDISGVSDYATGVWKFFTGKGYSPQATAGILGNMTQESGVDPTVIQGGGKGPAAGICQWENYNKKSARWKQLSDYATAKGKDWKDLQTQLEFVDMELSGTGNVDTYTSTLLKKYAGSYEAFKATTDINKATKLFEDSFERAGKPNMERRYAAAQSYYKQFANGTVANGDAGRGPAMATSAQDAPSDGSIPTSMNGWAYYQQSDPQWGGTVGNSTVSRGGCGPTSHAMMLTSIFGKQIDPLTMTKWAHNNGTWTGAMQWTMPQKVASTFGLNMTTVAQKDGGISSSDLAAIKEQIKAGRPVILSGRGAGASGSNATYDSPFTPGGHIVLAVGVDGQNRLIINDPRSAKRSKAYTDDGVLNIGKGIRGAWAFDTNGGSIPSGFSVGGDFTASGSYTSSDSSGSTGGGTAVEQMGAFASLGNIANNMIASIFNGKQVDMYGSSSTESGTTTGSLPVGDTSVDETLMLSGQEGFFQALGPSAAAAYNQYHIFPSTTLAQAALESAWGKSRVATANKNLFGIKWTGKYAPGITVTQGLNCPGNEQGGARPYNNYQSFADSMTDHGWFLGKYDRYKPALAASTPEEQIRLLGQSGYAEASTYGSSLQKMVDKYNLTKYNSAGTSGTMTGDAGKGDGNTYVVGSKVSKTQSNTLRTMSPSQKAGIKNTTTNNTMILNNGNISEACLEILSAMVEELKAINSNTASTAENTAKITVYSESTPVNSVTTGQSQSTTTKKASNSTQANDNTGYNLARSIAGFKK